MEPIKGQPIKGNPPDLCFKQKVKRFITPPEVLPPRSDVFTRREERVEKALQRSLIQYLSTSVKTGSAIWMGQLVGLAAASLLTFHPLLTVGLAAVGAFGGLLAEKMHLGEKLKKQVGKIFSRFHKNQSRTFNNLINAQKGGGAEKAKTVLKILRKGFSALGKTYQVLPKFLYPSLKNVTPVEKELIKGALEALPLKTVTSAFQIWSHPGLGPSLGAAGAARSLSSLGNQIFLDKLEMTFPEWNKFVTIHELGHTRDFTGGLLNITGPSSKAPWGKPPFMTDYAATSRFEDFAESYAFYHLEPENLQAVSPAKYQAMAKLHKPGIYDQIMDQSGVRRLGKQIAEGLDKVPGLRTALHLAAALCGPLTLHQGAVQYEKGVLGEDKKLAFEGKMNLAKGTAYSFKLTAPLGLALGIIHYVINRKLSRGKLSLEKANRIANQALAVMTGPVGIAAYCAFSEILKPGAEVKLVQGEKLTGEDKDLIKKVVTGTAIGGTAGTLAGLKGGSLAGAALGAAAGPLGSALGGFLGGIAGALGGSYAGARLGAKIGKKLSTS